MMQKGLRLNFAHKGQKLFVRQVLIITFGKAYEELY